MTRRFEQLPLPPGLLDSLLSTALRAPSAGFSQGTHFVVLEGDELAAWWRATVEPEWAERIGDGVGRASAVVIVLADAAAYVERYSRPDKAAAGLTDEAAWPVPFWLTDAAMVVQNLLLLVEANGLGALYYGLLPGQERALADLAVPDSLQPLGVVAIGHRAADDLPSGSVNLVGRKPSDEQIHRGRW